MGQSWRTSQACCFAPISALCALFRDHRWTGQADVVDAVPTRLFFLPEGFGEPRRDSPEVVQAASSSAASSGFSSTTVVVWWLLGVKRATTVAASTMQAPTRSARWYPAVDAWARPS
jgi:hypothetical protein